MPICLLLPHLDMCTPSTYPCSPSPQRLWKAMCSAATCCNNDYRYWSSIHYASGIVKCIASAIQGAINITGYRIDVVGHVEKYFLPKAIVNKFNAHPRLWFSRSGEVPSRYYFLICESFLDAVWNKKAFLMLKPEPVILTYLQFWHHEATRCLIRPKNDPKGWTHVIFIKIFKPSQPCHNQATDFCSRPALRILYIRFASKPAFPFWQQARLLSIFRWQPEHEGLKSAPPIHSLSITISKRYNFSFCKMNANPDFLSSDQIDETPAFWVKKEVQRKVRLRIWL
jgi:hypothetical protein